jgi:RHS repeat-associated protein
LLLDDSDHSYIYGPSSTPIAQVDDTSGAIEYLHADALGTPRAITNSAGAVTGTQSFDAYGTQTALSGAASTVFGFTGNLTDAITGLLYLRARDYDPETGQFLTVDPALDSTHQPYAYSGNDPVTNTDPTGLDAQSDAELYSRPYILLNMLLNVGSLGTYGVAANMCAGDDMLTSLTKAYNPIYSILEGGTNLSHDLSTPGTSLFRTGLDALELAGGVMGVLKFGGGGFGAVRALGRAESGLRHVASPSLSPASGARAVTIRNQRLSGDIHPTTGVPFDEGGFPDFSGWRHPDVPDVVIKPTGTRAGDFAAANRAAGLAKTPAGYTWHHNQQVGLMQLIDRVVHRTTGHTGGFSIWGTK